MREEASPEQVLAPDLEFWLMCMEQLDMTPEDDRLLPLVRVMHAWTPREPLERVSEVPADVSLW